MLMPSEANTASKVAVNLVSRSRIRKRNELIRSSSENAADGSRAETISEPHEFALDASVTPERILLR